ncbi:MAG: hypothetical protein GX228_09075 [Firmicutes bacterium]|jgi:hypothetical protein|nr:hypothetical protein [Bacillota bacterium]NLL89054.1 hypothetical protein [Bacillota bacterium]HKM18423.1 hypothetical protein [Limnochordia bacterium]
MGKPLFLICMLIVAVIIFNTYQGFVQNRGGEPQLGPDIRNAGPNFQGLTDKVAQAVLNNDWGLCRYYSDQLQMAWDRTKPSSPHRLDSILEVDQVLAKLHALVLKQDQAAALNAAAHLTRLFSELAYD